MVISCMAKVPLQAIRRILGVEAVRMMPSGPSTIQEKRGITAIYPNNEVVIRILRCLDLRVYQLLDEDLMHIFTVGVCLPAAFLESGEYDRARDEAYRLLAVLQWKLKEASGKEGSWESTDMFLRDLVAVQRVEVRFGNAVKTWYLNMTDSVSARLKEIGMSAYSKRRLDLRTNKGCRE